MQLPESCCHIVHEVAYTNLSTIYGVPVIHTEGYIYQLHPIRTNVPRMLWETASTQVVTIERGVPSLKRHRGVELSRPVSEGSELEWHPLIAFRCGSFSSAVFVFRRLARTSRSKHIQTYPDMFCPETPEFRSERKGQDPIAKPIGFEVELYREVRVMNRWGGASSATLSSGTLSAWRLGT